MKIKEIKIANYLGIENIEITDVDKKGAAFTGASRKGKTSILDAIIQAVANDAHREKFVKDEEHPARIYIKMDNGLEIMRTFTADGKKTTNVSIDGGRPNAPESYLKKLLGDKVVMIDPNIMMLAGKQKELSEQILALLPIKVTRQMALEWLGEAPPVDYTIHGLLVCKDIETLYYTKRADINREIKLLNGGIETTQEKIPEGYNQEEWRDVVLSDIFKKISEAENINNLRENARFVRDKESDDLDELKSKYEASLFVIEKSIISKQRSIDMEIQELEKRIEVLKSQKQQIADSTNDLKKKESERYEQNFRKRKTETKAAENFLADNPEIDVDVIREKAMYAETMKGYLNVSDRLKGMVDDLNNHQKSSDESTDKLNIIRSKPIELLKQNNLPIENLSISKEGNILINDLPLKNLSTSELVELLCDIEIAKTSEIQFVCVDRWESLGVVDSTVADLIKKKFADANIQLFYTKVTSGELTISEI